MPTPFSHPPKGRLLRTIRTVAWALFGIGGRKPDETDAPALSPLQILAIALAFMLVFVLTLVSLAVGISRL